MPMPNETHAQTFACSDDRFAPSRSPLAVCPLTLAAYTMDTIPVGRQQNIVVRIAGTR